jgi:hypothetical protein
VNFAQKMPSMSEDGAGGYFDRLDADRIESIFAAHRVPALVMGVRGNGQKGRIFTLKTTNLPDVRNEIELATGKCCQMRRLDYAVEVELS